MASGSNPPVGSIMEPFTRFAVLSAEDQAWLENYSKPGTVTIKNGIAYGIPITEENISIADSIASKLPVRRRWRRQATVQSFKDDLMTSVLYR